MNQTFRLVLLAALFSAGFACAASLTYTESATITGSLNGNPFDSLVTLSLTGDTSAITPDGGNTFLLPGTLTGDIASLGTNFTVTDVAGAIASSDLLDIAGFQDQTIGGLLYTNNDGFFDYDLSTTIGPLTGSTLFQSGVSIGTDHGALIFNSVDGNSATFTAAASGAPEPATGFLLGFSLLAMVALRTQSLSAGRRNAGV
jgi:hypothetical protein